VSLLLYWTIEGSIVPNWAAPSFARSTGYGDKVHRVFGQDGFIRLETTTSRH
jgi:hypothetical protein